MDDLPVAENTFCNCYAYIKNKYIKNLPPVKTILANLSSAGSVAVFYYPDSGLHHFAFVLRETETTYILDEANYKNCKQANRTIPKNDPNLLGFFSM